MALLQSKKFPLRGRRARRVLGCCVSMAWLCHCRAPAPDQAGPAAAATAEALPARPNEIVVQPPADLPEIRARGTLRVLLLKSAADELPRDQAPLVQDSDFAYLLAQFLGVPIVEFVHAPSQAKMLSMLAAGRADLIATPLAANDAMGPHFVRSVAVRHADAVLTVPTGTRPAPRSPADLLTRRVLVPADGSLVALLHEASGRLGAQLDFKQAPERWDSEDVLLHVAAGEAGAALVFSSYLEAYRRYRDDMQPAFVWRAQVPLALVVHKETPLLLDAMNGFIFENALTAERRTAVRGDLAQIKQSGTLRVALQNNAAAYYIHKGAPEGFQYKIVQRLAKKWGLRLSVVVPDQPAELTGILLDGRADIIAYAPPLAAPRDKRLALSQPIMSADHLLVQPAREAPIQSLQELRGRTLHVRRSSAYFATLQQLRHHHPDLQIAAAPEDLETEDLVAMVANGEIGLTVANSALLAANPISQRDIRTSLVLAREQPLVFAVRPDAPQLLAVVNDFLAQLKRDPAFVAWRQEYFAADRLSPLRPPPNLSKSGVLSPYDHLARKYGRQYGIDWRLIVAQMYQESTFNPRARSPSGAQGLLQLMPATAAELGVADPLDPESNVRGGVSYLAQLIEELRLEVNSFPERIRLGLASYNAGSGHVSDAQQLAQKKGWRDDTWFDHVEKAIQLLEQPRYYRHARYGYCRGSEPAQYVKLIQANYDAYAAVLPAEGRHNSSTRQPLTP